MTKELIDKMPKLYANEDKKPENVKIIVKFFCPWNQWTWYATEMEKDGEDFRFFGFVRGLENELGYFMLSELESVTGKFGLKIERDLHFGEHTLAEVMEKML